MRISDEASVQAMNSVASCSTLLPNIGKSDSHNTQQKMAHELGWSHSKVAQADYVWQHGNDKVKDKLLKGDYSVNQAYRDVKKRQAKFEREQARQQTPLAPGQPYLRSYWGENNDMPDRAALLSVKSGLA